MTSSETRSEAREASRPLVVAIDGPAGSGKSTIAKILARRHGFTYLDTGAMYRSVALAALNAGIDVADEGRVCDLARRLRVTFGRDERGEQTVFADDVEVTRDIRTPRVDAAVSSVARMPGVREAMVDEQRRVAGGDAVVCEGRDIGTAVFPQAQVKVYLTASPETRAHRRSRQNQLRGMGTGSAQEEAEILASIIHRDEVDSHREVSPLRAAEDAQVIDTSDKTIDQVVELIDALVTSALARA